MMNPLAFVSGLLALTCFLLALFILKVGRLKLHRLWAWFNISVGIWGAGICLASLATSQESAFRFWQFAHAGGFFVGVFFYHVVHNFCELKNKKFLFFAYAQAIFFSVLNLIGITGYKVIPTFGPIYYIKVLNFLYVAITILWFLPVIYGHAILFNALRSAKGKKRNQIKYLLLSMFVGFSGGIQHFLPVYDINVYPYGNLLITLYSLIATYAIFKHQLLDIEVIIKRTLVFAGLFGMVMAVVAGTTALVQGFIGQYLRMNPAVAMALSVALAIFLYEPTKRWLINITDRFLFQKKEDMRIVLNRLAQNIITILDLQRVGETILTTLQESLRLEAGLIIMIDKNATGYEVLNSFDLDAPQFRFDKEDLFIKYIAEKRDAINIEHDEIEGKTPTAVLSIMQKFKAVVCIPLIYRNSLIGILALGKKKSDEAFSVDEINAFPILAGQAAIALSNARLFEETVEEREAKIRAEDVARRVHYAETLGHEMKNKLAMSVLTTKNLMERTVPKFRSIHEKYLAGKVAEDLSKAMQTLYGQVYKSAQELKAHLDVMKIITKTAQSHLSSDEETFEEVYVKMVWEDTVKDLNVKDIHIQFVGPNDRNFIVWGNPVRLQQVFRNMIQNSMDAMCDQNNKSITLECSIREIKGNGTGYFIYTDNGPGVPAEFRTKMFDKGISTKPKPRSANSMDSGSGYGLYMCKDIIEVMHKGKIWYDETYAEGARFVFWIPTQDVKEA